MEISHILQSWYTSNSRDLPWRQTKDAYRIWLSEVILQQTRVAQGFDYYNRFVNTYPTVGALASAPEDDVLKLWQGLGYYSRARNLHKAAKMVVERQGATDRNTVTFPNTYAELIQLPGIGPYTAAAIASFSSDEAVAVVDGNVYRLLARLFDIETPIDSTSGQNEFLALASELLDKRHPGRHNQAIMEFGALHCTPTSPRCEDCPLQSTCLAYANHSVTERPVKAGKVKVRERHLHYYLFKYNNEIWVHQRGAGDIWQGLWEFYAAPLDSPEVVERQTSHLTSKEKLENLKGAWSIKHQLTHQLLRITFKVIELTEPITTLPADYVRISWQEWQEKAVPKPIFEANKHFSALFD